MLFMVTSHCRGSVPADFEGGGWLVLANAVELLLRTSNALFFMLSGKFALAASCESVSDYRRYYEKKLLHIGIPMLCYMLLRSIYDYGGAFWELTFWKVYVKNVCYEFNGKEYWFLYQLVGLLLLAPLLHKMTASMKKGEAWLFLSMGLMYNTIISYARYVNLRFSWSYPFGGWALYFFLGYFLEKVIDTPKKEKAALIAGGFCAVEILAQQQLGMTSNIYDLVPFFTVVSCAVFFLLKKGSWEKSGWAQALIRQAGKYSFAIYLVHNPVRRYLGDLFAFQPGPAYWLNVLLLVACTLAISFLIAFVCENTLVRFLQWALR